MQRLFYPQSIVVIGVSEKPDNSEGWHHPAL